MVQVFAVSIFFILFRETLETAIIISILLAFLKQQVSPDRDAVLYKRLRKQIWLGTIIGFVICLIIGCGIIGAFYGLGKNHWAGTEDIWEGVFCIIASVIITIMGAAILRVSKLQDKWQAKLAKALETKDNRRAPLGHRFKLWAEKYAMFMLPFITILREGLEAVVFIGGVSLGLEASAIPLPTVCGLAAGSLCGFLIYKVGNRTPMQLFLVISTCFLYLVAAGLFSRGVWLLEADQWNKLTGGDASENGSGPGSYDIRKSVWHVNCCNPELNGGGGWGIFNALFGWQNSATYGSVISYNVYWIVVILSFFAMRWREKYGHWPLMKSRRASNSSSDEEGDRRGSSKMWSSDEDAAVVEDTNPSDTKPEENVVVNPTRV